MTTVESIRRLAPHYIGSPATGLTTSEMQAFIAGTLQPSDEQLVVLARLMKLEKRR